MATVQSQSQFFLNSSNMGEFSDDAMQSNPLLVSRKPSTVVTTYWPNRGIRKRGTGSFTACSVNSAKIEFRKSSVVVFDKTLRKNFVCQADGNIGSVDRPSF